MIRVGLKFPSSRFHATPWGRHVNEGAPEWPPSPWRFLRTLVATWKRKLNHQLVESQVRQLLTKILDPPQFLLPPASAGHTRHFMPWFKKGPNDKTLVFDAFVVLPRDAELLMIWPEPTLSQTESGELALLLAHVNFMGRAESWCSARLLDDNERSDENPNCLPIQPGSRITNDEIVRVLCADGATVFDNQHTPKISRTTGRGRSRTTVVTSLYDPDWHLCMETLSLQKEGWSDPPGSRWVSYQRPRDCFRIAPVGRSARCATRPKMQVARFALDSAVLPMLVETLSVAESARRMLMGIYGRLNGTNGLPARSCIFSGKDENGKPLQDHTHAYYLPTDEDGDGRLDHLTVVATAGFDDGELKALDRLHELKSRKRLESGHRLLTLLLGLGRLEDYEAGPLRSARVWTSSTPFLAPRYLKKRGRNRDPKNLWAHRIDFLRLVLEEELDRLHARRPDWKSLSIQNVKILPLVNVQGVFHIGPTQLRPIQFQRFRQKQGDDGGNRAAGAFQIEFPTAVRGPISLGHSSHFGMGLFVPSPTDPACNLASNF